jgi:hypothetical protein
MSAGGRWAYTLYVRPSVVPFLHALDTTGRRAVCIDLPSLAKASTGSAHLRLGPGGTTLQVDVGSVTWARINTHTFRVSAGEHQPGAPPARSVARARPSTRGHWELIVVLVGGLGVLAAAGA